METRYGVLRLPAHALRRYSRGSGIEIATQEPRPVQLDGDEFGEAVSVRTRVEPGALRVVVPKDHATDSL